jgi:hypothetical protein
MGKVTEKKISWYFILKHTFHIINLKTYNIHIKGDFVELYHQRVTNVDNNAISF